MGDNQPVVSNPAESAAAPAAAEMVANAPASAKPKCSKKKKIIIGCTAGAVAILGASGLVFASVLDNREENIALSAVSDLLSNHARSINGYVDFAKTSTKNTFKSSNEISHVRVELDNNTSADNEAKTTATFIFTYGGKDYKLVVDSVIIKDYTLYVSVSNLKETINQFVDSMKNDSSFSSYISAYELYEDIINQVVGEIEGTWWKISVPDVIDSLDDNTMSDDQKQKAKDAYTCMVEAANKASKDGGKFAKLYKDNAFVGIEKYTGDAKPSAEGDLYSVKLDSNKFANFVNALPDQLIEYGFKDCAKMIREVSENNSTVNSYEEKIEDVEENAERGKVEPKQFDETFEKINKHLVITIKNGFFSHKLSGVYVSGEKDDYKGTIDFKFDGQKGGISAPENAKNITELVDNVKKAIEEGQETATCKYYKKNYPSLYSNYCDTATNKPKTSSNSYLI